jgi:hypothetical protein
VKVSKSISFWLFALALLHPAQLEAAGLNIVVTGDSNGTAVGPVRMSFAMQAQGVGGKSTAIASGGSNAPLYAGLLLDINHRPYPAFHNQAIEALNGPVYGNGAQYLYGSVIEPNPDPDAVIIMLGTSDAYVAPLVPAVWPIYQTIMSQVYDYLTSTPTPSGKYPDIFVTSPLPILSDSDDSLTAQADSFLTSTMSPWIESTVEALQEEGRKIHFVDVNSAIRQQPNWQNWYSDNGQTPGYFHLYGQNAIGYTWLSNYLLNSILDVHAGDANLDGQFDGIDYVAWADHFGASGNWSQGDFNHDGIVDGLDYVIWSDRFDGAGVSPSLMTSGERVTLGGSDTMPVPEPETAHLSLLAVATVMLFRRRRLAAFRRNQSRWRAAETQKTCAGEILPVF